MVKVHNPIENILESETITFDQWCEQLPELDKVRQDSLLIEVWDYIHLLYRNRKCPDGHRLLTSAIAVATLIVRINPDPHAICAGLLRHIYDLEDGVDLKVISDRFGSDVLHLLSGFRRMNHFAKLHHAVDDAEKSSQAEIIREMLFATIDDPRVVFIKLAEQLYQMRMLSGCIEKRQREVARETADIYAPLANLLGIWQVKWELEDLSFRYLEPQTYKKVAKLLAERRIDREQYIEQVIQLVSEKLDEEGIKGEVVGRPKHIYSIWRKMQRKGVGFHDVFDVRAVRVLVNTVAECYGTLGIIHGLWPHIPQEFDDYIASPKGNNYQSLHTAVIGPQGKTLEIQIRTYAMHEHSELGVASHWRYKDSSGYDDSFLQKVSWLRQYLENNKDDESISANLLNQFSLDSLDERVYVITPKGNVIDLPKGATPIDFAYSIHTEVGHRCRGAKVNDRIVPLTYTLKSGERVEILLFPEPKPSRDWLVPAFGYVMTSKARSKIRTWFREQNLDQNIADGKVIYEREVRRLGLSSVDITLVLTRCRFQTAEELWAALGRGDASSDQLAHWLRDLIHADEKQDQITVAKRHRDESNAGEDVVIRGVGNLLTQIANCCKPAPDDPIIGFITRGRGVTIHHLDCPNILHMNDEERNRLIDVSWASTVQKQYITRIVIEAYDRSGLLSDIMAVFSSEKINVTAVNTKTDPDDNVAKMNIVAQVDDITQLHRVMSKIGKVSNVFDVRRVGS